MNIIVGAGVRVGQNITANLVGQLPAHVIVPTNKGPRIVVVERITPRPDGNLDLHTHNTDPFTQAPEQLVVTVEQLPANHLMS